MKITMLQDYDWQVPGKRQWVAFKAGWSGRVTRAQGADLIAAGVVIQDTTRTSKPT